jgi:hypothetical protein
VPDGGPTDPSVSASRIEIVPDRSALAPDSKQSTLDVTTMNGAFWAAEPSESTIDLTLLYGAFWAAAPLSE